MSRVGLRPDGRADGRSSAATADPVDRTFGAEEIIVSKTDRKGVITYANDVFVRVSGYAEEELVGRPHSLVRHPQMPRAVFRFMWSEIEAGREVFAYVVNLARDGAPYWVFAHVTPTFDAAGGIVAYHSNRRSPARQAIERIRPVYAWLLEIEARCRAAREAADAGHAALQEYLAQQGLTYSEFVWSMTTGRAG